MLIHQRAIRGAAIAAAFVLMSFVPATAAHAQTCGPMDVVFVVDETGSMTNVINEIQTQVSRIADSVTTASGGDFQFGVIGMPDNNIRVLLNPTPGNRAGLDTAVAQLAVAGGCGGVPYDEALNTALNSLPLRSGTDGAQLQPFTAGWRGGSTKIIILITDTVPQAFTCSFVAGVHDVAVHDFAVQAATDNIKIASVFLDTGNPNPDLIKSIMEDAATTSGGVFKVAQPDASDLADIIVDIIQTCGGSGGGAVTSVFVDPTELLLNNGQSGTVRVINYSPGTTANPVSWSADPPNGITATFTPVSNPREGGTEEQRLTITVGPDTPQGTHLVAVRASRDGARDNYAIVHVIVDCRAPFFLGTGNNQPQSQSVRRGTSARLKATPGGDGPFRYQWYRGHTGNTNFPIAGATSAELNTGAIQDYSTYWVRVSNACGSRDSAVATVQPTN